MKARRALALCLVLVAAIPAALILRPSHHSPAQAVSQEAFRAPDGADADRRGATKGEQNPPLTRSTSIRMNPVAAFNRGVRQAARVRQLADVTTQLPPVGWSELGPRGVADANEPNPITGQRTAVSGRVTAIAVDPATCTGNVCFTMYLGAGTGGVWKTTDSGIHWMPLLDDQPDLSVGVITLDPVNPNIIYVGTGDPSHYNGQHGGAGILRSTDGGLTWQVLGSSMFSDRSVTSLVIDPRTAGGTNATLLAGSTFSYAGGTATLSARVSGAPNLPELGVYVSHDSGQTWTLSKSSTYGIDSLAIDPTNPSVAYAGIHRVGVFRTTDGGASWKRRGSGLPGADNFGLIRVAIAPSDPRVLYAGIDAFLARSTREKLYRTSNAGGNWSQIKNVPDACGSQCFDNLVLAVDPGNPRIVYNGGSANYAYLASGHYCLPAHPLKPNCSTALMKTTNAGTTWSDISENGRAGPIHPDAHALLVDPKNHLVVYEGVDGGLFHSADGGKTWNDLNLGLGTLQTQSISVDSVGNIVAGTQDNGTLIFQRSTGTWTHVLDGDGGVTAVNPLKPSVVYFTQAGANLFRNDQGGAARHTTYVSAFWGDYDALSRGDFYEPFALAPSKPSDIFFGTYRVWRSKTGGGTDGNNDGATFDSTKDKNDWVPISFDLSCGAKPSKPGGTCDSQANNGQGISALAISPTNPNVLVAASAIGHLWVTRNALANVTTDASCLPWKHKNFVARCNFVSGPTWTRIDSGLPKRSPTAISFLPSSSSAFVVSYSGYDEDTPTSPGHLFLTRNFGHTWTALTGTGVAHSLPDLPFTDVLVNPQSGHIYAAAAYGLYTSSDGGVTWSRFDSGLPAVPVYQMALLSSDLRMDVVTYGRGVWEANAP